ncbi:MAG: S1C family serine protease [Candidatus Absconditabacterales bacterium]
MLEKNQTLKIISLNITIIFIGLIFIFLIVNHKINSKNILTNPIVIKENTNQNSDLFGFQNGLISLINNSQKSIVSIGANKNIKFYMEDPSALNGPGSIKQDAKIGGGSGIIISKKGYILTNKHVIQDINAKYAVTTNDGKTYNVDKIWFDDNLDVAILKIVDDEGNELNNLLEAKIIGINDKVKIGQLVIAIGNPRSEYANNVTMGIIGGKNKQLKIKKDNLYIGLYQTDAKINPGNSGGPLIDISGQIIGINTAINEQGMAFALPISKEFITTTLNSIQKYGKIIRPLIGIQYADTKQGIVVNDVLDNLPANKAGIEINDNIVAINEKEINNDLPFLYQLYTYNPGENIMVTMLRNGTYTKIPITLGETQ